MMNNLRSHQGIPWLLPARLITLLLLLLLSVGVPVHAQTDGPRHPGRPLNPDQMNRWTVDSSALNPSLALTGGTAAITPQAAGLKAQNMVYPPRLPHETLPEYLTRNPIPRAATRATRLPAGEFTLNYFGDLASTDLNPGDGLCADSLGGCGLRAAIMEANALETGTIITIPAGVTITLEAAGIDEDGALTGDLDIYNGMVIRGGGANTTIIDAAGVDRVFDIYEGVVDVLDVTITGGDTGAYTDPTKANGGGIWVNCGVDLLLDRVTITGNNAAIGGGVYVGGACTASPNILYMYNSTIHDNTATVSTGGLDVYQNGLVTLQNSTVSQNTAAGFAAGILIENDGVNFPTVTLDYVTIADNIVTGTSAGAGLWSSTAGNKVTLSSSIVGYNFAGGVPEECFGTYTSGGDNVYRNDDGCVVTASDVVATGLAINLLALNLPGTTPTNALPAGSVAVDLNDDSCPAHDQRRVTRPSGPGCDSGAYEFGDTARLLLNEGFESGIVDWTLKNPTGDKVKCNKPGKIFAHTGNCAFMFKGVAPGVSKLQQRANINGLIFTTGDALQFSVYLNANAAQPGRIKIVVKYSDAAKSKLTAGYVPTAGYQQLTGSTAYASPNVTKIKSIASSLSTSGKMYLDDFTLSHVVGGAPAAGRIPLPGVDAATYGSR